MAGAGSRDQSRRHIRPALLLVSAVLLTACRAEGPQSSGDSEVRRAGGRVVVAVDAEPAALNPFLASGMLALNAFLSDKVLVGAFRIAPDSRIVPTSLLTGEPVVTPDPFTVTYSIRPDAVWSDGTAVTPRDFEFTWRTVMDPRWQVGVRDGYDRIASIDATSPQTARVTFNEPYGHWRLLFLRGGLLPAHHLEGKNFDEVWKDRIDVANGPFLFGEWVKGDHLTLVRNPRYFGPRPGIEELEIRFIPDPNTAFQQFRAGDVQVLRTAAQHVTQVREMEGRSSQTAPGGGVVYMGFNASDSRLSDVRVRRAISLALDREVLVDAAFGTDHPDLTPLDSLVFTANQDSYVPHFERYRHDPAGAARLLDDARCTRPSPAAVRRCPSGPLSLTMGVRAGDDAARRLFEVLQPQLAAAGIAVQADFAELNTLMGKAQAGAYPLLLEGFDGAPEPVLADVTWTCGGSLNFRRYCNREVSGLIDKGARELDPKTSAELYNQADALMVDDPPAIPLVQLPVTLAWQEQVQGPELNPAFLSPFWNAEEWSLGK